MDAKYGEIGGIGERFGPALTVLAMVISRPTDDRAILDMGRKTLGIDQGTPRLLDGPEGVRFLSFSEEHSTLAVEGAARELRPGDQVRVIPGHGCTTVNLYDRYIATRGGVVEAVWPIAARGRAR